MEQVKVAGAVGLNGMLAMVQVAAKSPFLETLLTMGQIGVALVTILYIATKVWKLWHNKKDSE